MLVNANALHIPLKDKSVQCVDLAYIAGLVDGEAYIGIKKSNSKLNGRVNPAYHERIQIRMVDEEAIRFLSETLGGNYYKEKPNCKGGRPLYCYQASDLKASTILESLLPYLKVKRNSAFVVLELRERKNSPHKAKEAGRSRHSETEIRIRENLYLLK